MIAFNGRSSEEVPLEPVGQISARLNSIGGADTAIKIEPSRTIILASLACVCANVRVMPMRLLKYTQTKANKTRLEPNYDELVG